jgi:hypothetical protein
MIKKLRNRPYAPEWEQEVEKKVTRIWSVQKPEYAIGLILELEE